MNKSNNESGKNVLDMQQESGSENEESDSITDHSSSMSETALQQQKNGKTAKAAAKRATQFSVQRSDADGLRMKISAIRPVAVQNSVDIKNSENVKENSKQKSPQLSNKTIIHNNNNTLETLKVKITNKTVQQKEQQSQQSQKEEQQNRIQDINQKNTNESTKMLVTTLEGTVTIGSNASVVSDNKIEKTSTAITTLNENATEVCKNSTNIVELPLILAPQAPCLSDATESGCSEATTTTIAAGAERTAKKIKVKRKKAQNKNSEVKKSVQKNRTQSPFSSDTDDEPVKQQQRAPRLLLTAISAKMNSPQLKSLTTVATSAHGSDNIGISSSDNELPNLVNAAIKRVESDTDDTGEVFRKAKAKHVPQYQSTLLQDFMEKTQMLGQTPVRVTSPERQIKGTRTETITNSYSNSNSNSNSIQDMATSSGVSKKRRGRPKKTDGIETETLAATVTASNIIESADSGVISTTSTTQSTSPSPRMPLTTTATATTTISSSHQKQRKHETETASSPVKSYNENTASSSSSTKPKIDIAYLDKRMYATERVLYPPPRNKRRQSGSLASLQKSTQQDKKSTNLCKITKEELQLDPVWRKIDVNKKFQRPSLSGYKGDGSVGNITVCSKILAAKSGYVSDYGSVHTRSHHHHNSGYKSDASGKSRYSIKSCMNRRSRAKSCGYRSDCKESRLSLKSTKFRRKRRPSLIKTHSESVGNLNDDQDILQLAGLSLGQSSEESNEYVCKPSLQNSPTTSISNKYGEINRFVATGEYFTGSSTAATFSSLQTKRLYDTTNEDGSQDGFTNHFSGKLLMQRKNSFTSELTHDILPHTSRKIKSRRSSAASYCSSYYSGVSKTKRRRKRKSYRFPSTSKSMIIDSKLLTDIEIITSTFNALCRIQTGDKATNSLNSKEKLLAETSKFQCLPNATGIVNTKREGRDKRTLKKRKLNENIEALHSVSGIAVTPSGGSTKRRHKKANSSSPDDHKLPLKKRHYLLTPGEKSNEAAAAAVAAKLFASNAEAWAAAAAAAKSSASTKSQQQFGAKMSKTGVTPKKRHLLQNAAHLEETGSIRGSNSSPLRIVVDTMSISGGKLLDISPISMSSVKQINETAHKKRSRLEGVVSKIANHTDEQTKDIIKNGTKTIINAPQLDSETSCPPPGVFEPSVELEIQIPPIAKLTEAAANIITKSEVDSPLLMDLNKTFTSTSTKIEGARVVETLLTKTGGNLILKRKRKKFNRTGFPTVRRKKRKFSESMLLDITPDINEQTQNVTIPSMIKTSTAKSNGTGGDEKLEKVCDRVPQIGEKSDTFLERANRTPRLSVVALERLQGTPIPDTNVDTIKERHTIKQKLNNRKQKIEQDADDENTKPSKKSKLIQQIQPKASKEPQRKLDARATRGRGRKSKMMSNVDAVKEIKTEPISISGKHHQYMKSSQTKTENASFTKSTVHKIITAKTLETKVKLPAGIDPNTNFSCKIRLKRRIAVNPAVNSKIAISKTPISTDAEIDAEAAAKDSNIDYIEHDPLPLNECNGIDCEATSDTGDEKSSATSSQRHIVRIKKTYLVAGLFSDYFKMDHNPAQRALKMPKGKKKEKEKSTAPVIPFLSANSTISQLLPPPPYCEKYFRRTLIDFKLPYDIHLANENSKLPNRVDSWNYRKIRTNDYTAVKPNLAGIDHPTCNCKPDVGCGDNCLNRVVYTECSPTNCPSRDKCHNQKIQRHEIAPGIERFMTENKGYGVRTKLSIKKGTYILEYVGEVVTEREFKHRMGTIYLNDIHHYCLHLDGGLVIDGHRTGSEGRFVNHSCEPNCEMQKWSVNGLSRMALFAKRNIEEGEELTYDYNFSLFNPKEGQPCLCNTSQCRGVIGGKSQRVKPLPVESKPLEVLKGRQRKRKAYKSIQNAFSKDIAVARVQQLSEKEKKLVKQKSIFLVRNFEKFRRCKIRRNAQQGDIKSTTPNSLTPSLQNSTPGQITQRRPSTPSSLATQISALCTARNIKTRGLTLAVQDPEVEKMAKVALILRGICTDLETLKCQNDENLSLISLVLTTAANNKKKKTVKPTQKQKALDLKTVQINIEQGYYKDPQEFDADMQKIFSEAKQTHGEDQIKLDALHLLMTEYEAKKQDYYSQLFELLGAETPLTAFRTKPLMDEPDKIENTTKILLPPPPPPPPPSTTPPPLPGLNDTATANRMEKDSSNAQVAAPIVMRRKAKNKSTTADDVIRCICGLYKDEGLMIQCARCMAWQHTECTKADVNAENYLCEKCDPREVDPEIPLEGFTDDGHRYYLQLIRGDLPVRGGDTVYVLRDIPIKDADGNIVPSQKHTYLTIGHIDYTECDIFRVERLWKTADGKRFIFGHHFLRPHETYHEPTRRFYPNEVVRVPLYEVVPIELVIGRCWVLDRTTFCKGRPIDCTSDEHCYICELRVDKTARFFAKAKVNYPTCTQHYAFRTFPEKLKISKTYAPHVVDPALLKSKKQKTEATETSTSATPITITNTATTTATTTTSTNRQLLNKTPQSGGRKYLISKSPAPPANTHLISPSLPTVQTIKQKRTRLEQVLKVLKVVWNNTQEANEPPIDLSYLLSGRGARQRKTTHK